MKRWYQGSLMLMAVLSAPAGAAEPNVPSATAPPNPECTLEALVSDTLERNPELEFFEAEIAAAKAGRRSAGRLANPELSGSAGRKTLRGGGLEAEGVAWSASLLQPFEWPGRQGLRKAIANRDIELAELGAARFKLALAARVRTLAYGWFAAREKATASHEVAERFQELREVLVQRDPAGLTPLLETRVIEATELTMQRKAGDATLATQSALLELNQLRGLTPDTRLAVRPPQLVFRPAADREILIALAHTNNFDLRLRAVELAQQGFRVDLARNERFPSIAVGPTISEENAGDRERIIGVGVSFPLPLWQRNEGNIAIATARRRQAEVSLQSTFRDVERKVIAAALTYETKLREMSRWRPDAVAQFREAADVADRHYRLGAVPMTTYVELQQQYLEAVESLLDTKQAALEAAQNLELLTGLTPPLVSVKEEPK